MEWNGMMMKCNNADLAAQAVFHAMFGTKVEDLGVLSSVTNVKNWYQRKDFSEFFKRRSEQNQVKVQLPMFSYVSKMLTANPTKFSGTIRPMVTSGLVFLGTENVISQPHLMNISSAGINYQSWVETGDAAGLSFSLRELVTNLRNEMGKVGSDVAGTTGWHKVENTDGGLVYRDSDLIL